MKKTLKHFGLVFVLIITLFVFAACGATNDGGNGGDSANGDGTDGGNIATVDGVQYTLSDGWEYDEEYACFSNGGIRVTIEKDIVDECGSAQARYDEKYEYEDEGIDYSMISVNGEDAVYTEEPVNEIMYCNLYFYIDGKEHNLVIESDFDSYEEDKETILGFFEGISW